MADMKTSAAGRAFITRWEGVVLHPYLDQAGKWTIGVGHLVKQGEDFGEGITAEEADQLLASDLAVAEHAVNSCVTVAIGQNAFDALTSFAFNCGGGALASSSLRAFLNRGDTQNAANAFLLWDKRTDPRTERLVVDSGLLRRRQAERALFLTPDAPEDRPTTPEPLDAA